MSDEPLKKPGTRPESPTLDRLKAELSAGLKKGEDPLYYDWTRVAEAPPSEAAYVPPTQIQTRNMDTGDLAAVIGREAAEAARHAPSPGNTVVIDDGGERAERGFDIDMDDDVVRTEEMSGEPATDDDFRLPYRRSVGSWRRTGVLISLVVAAAAVVLCAVYSLTKPGIDARSTSRTESTASAVLDGHAAPASRGAPIARVPAIETSTARAVLSAASAIDPMKLPAEASTSQSPRRTPAAAAEPNMADPGRAPLPASTARSRAVPPPRAEPAKPNGKAIVDPLFTENPGY